MKPENLLPVKDETLFRILDANDFMFEKIIFEAEKKQKSSEMLNLIQRLFSFALQY